jgi:hypothetical protein
MIILRELSESDATKHDLPFDIIFKPPYVDPPHACVVDQKTGVEIGQFQISAHPQNPGDIKGYKQGISDDAKKIIFSWSRLRCKNGSVLMSNWEYLKLWWDIKTGNGIGWF